MTFKEKIIAVLLGVFIGVCALTINLYFKVKVAELQLKRDNLNFEINRAVEQECYYGGYYDRSGFHCYKEGDNKTQAL